MKRHKYRPSRFYQTPTTTPASAWERRYAKRGIIAGSALGAIAFAISLGAGLLPAALVATAVIGIPVSALAIGFWWIVGRDVSYNGELQE